MKRFKTLLYLIILVALGWWLLHRAGKVPSFSNLFEQQPVTIENTDVWVKEVKALSQLVTISAYNELVADSVRTLLPDALRLPSSVPPGPLRRMLGERRLVLVGKTTVHVGINMQGLRAGAIQVAEDSIHLQLPRATVLDVILNPSGVDVFIEEGAWNGEAVAALKNSLRRQAVRQAVGKGLLQQAENKASDLFTAFFKSAGFAKVAVTFAG